MSRKSIRIFALSTLFAVLAGCGTHSGGGYYGRYSDDAEYGNYKCKAIDTEASGHVSIGWASTQSQARDNALDKCRSHSGGNGNCRILDCINEM